MVKTMFSSRGRRSGSPRPRRQATYVCILHYLDVGDTKWSLDRLWCPPSTRVTV